MTVDLPTPSGVIAAVSRLVCESNFGTVLFASVPLDPEPIIVGAPASRCMRSAEPERPVWIDPLGRCRCIYLVDLEAAMLPSAP